MSRLTRCAVVVAVASLLLSFMLADCALSEFALLGPCTMNGAGVGGCGGDTLKGCQNGQIWDDSCDNDAVPICFYQVNINCGPKVDPGTCAQLVPWQGSNDTFTKCGYKSGS